MKYRICYLYMEIRKTFRIMPRMALQAVLLMTVMGLVVAVGAGSMKSDPLAVSVDIAVAVEEDNVMTRMALRYVENMESVSRFCHFQQVTKEEGSRMLEKGQVAAVILLPEQLVEGIMNGTNPAVTICFPKNAGLETMLFRELTRAGEGLLRVAQAQIYGAGDTAAKYGLSESISQMEAEIDSYNLAFALDRLALFETEDVSVFGSLSVIQFYLASGIVLFLLLAGMALYPIVQREPAAFGRQMERQGVGMIWQCFCQWFCGLLCMGLLTAMVWAVITTALGFMPDSLVWQLFPGYPEGASVGLRIGIAALMLITVTTFLYMLYSLAGSRTGGVLFIFLLSVVMVYLSGGLVPSVFLPKLMQAAGEWLPTTYLIRAAGAFVTGRGESLDGQCLAALCLYTAVCGAAACYMRYRIRGDE